MVAYSASLSEGFVSRRPGSESGSDASTQSAPGRHTMRQPGHTSVQATLAVCRHCHQPISIRSQTSSSISTPSELCATCMNNGTALYIPSNNSDSTVHTHYEGAMARRYALPIEQGSPAPGDVPLLKNGRIDVDAIRPNRLLLGTDMDTGVPLIPLEWNILFSPERALHPTNLEPITQPYLNTFATEPAMREANLIVPDNVAGPWTISIVNANGVTVGDLLTKLYTDLHRVVSPEEPQLARLSSRKRKALEKLRYDFRERHAEAGLPAELCRFDFLMGRVHFGGLSRAYTKVGSPWWGRYIPGLKVTGEEMYNYFVVELMEKKPRRMRI